MNSEELYDMNLNVSEEDEEMQIAIVQSLNLHEEEEEMQIAIIQSLQMAMMTPQERIEKELEDFRNKRIGKIMIKNSKKQYANELRRNKEQVELSKEYNMWIYNTYPATLWRMVVSEVSLSTLLCVGVSCKKLAEETAKYLKEGMVKIENIYLLENYLIRRTPLLKQIAKNTIGITINTKKWINMETYKSLFDNKTVKRLKLLKIVDITINYIHELYLLRLFVRMIKNNARVIIRTSKSNYTLIRMKIEDALHGFGHCCDVTLYHNNMYKWRRQTNYSIRIK